MDQSRIDLIEKFGTAGTNWYVHLQCINDFVASKFSKADAVIETVRFWESQSLLEKFKDITVCDHCHRSFVTGDDGYLLIRQTSVKELAALVESKRGK
jgi:hypothetical protein